MSELKVTLWGTRGSLVQTDSDKIKYGLETSCISIETENEIFLIDCGSGIRKFDSYFYGSKKTQKKINILLTHYHHDHILGLAFANFVYDENLDIEIFGHGDVYDTLNNYFKPPYFPVNLFELTKIKTRSVKCFETLNFGNIEIETTLLHHPQNCIGYKFKHCNKTIVIAIDYEYKLDETKDVVEEFIKGSDYLIIDAFSTEEDYKKGWGHNSIEDVVSLSNKLEVGKCIITHHNVSYSDEKLDDIQANLLEVNPNVIMATAEYSFDL